MGENAQSALECVDPIHVQQCQPFTAEDYLVLPDGLLNEIPVSVALMLTPGQSVHPAIVECEFSDSLGYGPV